MNSNFNKFDFDLGMGSNNRSAKSLNDQKNKPNNSYSYSTTPAWTHQPAPSQPGMTRSELGGPPSLVGDIMGKNWNSTPQKVAVASSIGFVNKNPNLFGDLVNSALGQNKSNSNVPLKNATPVKNSFSMGSVADSLPRNSNSWGSFQSSGSNAGINMGSGSGSGLHSGTAGINMGSGLGGQSLRSGNGGGGMSSNKDPFGSFVDFSSKPMKNANTNSSTKLSADFDFGGFQNASKPNTSTFPSGNSNPLVSNANSVPKPVTGGDSFDMFFPSVVVTGGGNAPAESGVGGEQFYGGDEWGFGGGHEDGNTTELDGLPPPPVGVSVSTAKGKGLDNYKQGQYADAIKWLSWAEVLLEKSGERVGSTEVLSCRASCYKEVGEYKKAVADCSKVLKYDEKNVAILVQRALLYESMEKYRLGADDLRTVMKLDPGNRVARSTIHRLNKMAD